MPKTLRHRRDDVAARARSDDTDYAAHYVKSNAA
jgi:hypothetical protein